METEKLLDELNRVFTGVIEKVSDVKTANFFRKEKIEKWSIAEELQHLTLSILPITNLFLQPKLITERWGHSNRKSRNIELFLKDYQAATLGQEWKAFPPFVPKTEGENKNYAERHSTSNQNKIDDFYSLTGKQIESLRDKFEISSYTEKKGIIETFDRHASSLLSISKKMDDFQMDDIQIPLPYIGLVTFKEILYFTLNHTKHHLNTINHLSKYKR